MSRRVCLQRSSTVFLSLWRWEECFGTGRWLNTGQRTESVEQIRAGVAAYRATGAEIYRPYFLGLLAEAYGNRGRPDAGLEALAEALTRVETTGERLYAARDLYRLKGQLLLARSLGQLHRGRGVLPTGAGARSPPTSQIAGATGERKPGSTMAAAGKT